MRQAQHNKRSRGRGRKSSSPGNRVYESNGPDVKVRGNASHVAEKYVNLARDASLSGDLVAAENYLQHAEHYFRLVAAAQTQIQTQARQDQAQNRPRLGGDQPNGRPSPEGADSVEAGDAGQEKSANEEGSDGAAEQAEGSRSAGRRRPQAARKSAKSENGDDSEANASRDQMTNGADELAEVEGEQIAETDSRPGDGGAVSEDVAEAEAEI
jgi:uncharacterized protein DUF4167